MMREEQPEIPLETIQDRRTQSSSAEQENNAEIIETVRVEEDEIYMARILKQVCIT